MSKMNIKGSKIPVKSMLLDTETVNLFDQTPKTFLMIEENILNQQHKNQFTGNEKQILRVDLKQSTLTILNNNQDQYQNTLTRLQMKKLNLASRKNDTFEKRKFLSTQQNQKIKRICNNFIIKLKRNNIFRRVLIQENDLELYNQYPILKGIKFNQNIIILLKIMMIITFFGLIISQSLVFSFGQLKQSSFVRIILFFSSFIYLSQITFNILAVKRIQGRLIESWNDIVLQYLKSGYLIFDIFIQLLIIINLFSPSSFMSLLLLINLILQSQKIGRKIDKLEQFMIKNYYYEKYLSLLKIMVFNILYAHVIALLLNQIAQSNPGHNWQASKGLEYTPWNQRYIWSYYWATTIMLTVGFGDIIPTNSNEALFIVFVQFAGCIAFSYNISCLGAMISNIKSQIQQTQKSRKIFEDMDKKIGFSSSLFSKIEHFINQSAYVRSKFNISEEKQFVASLPSGYKKQVLCETNKKLLKSLPFFSCLLDKTIYMIAEHLQRHIYYPDQPIKTISSNFTIYVLQHGKIGYICKKFGSKYNNAVTNEVKVEQKKKPFILAQDFITLQRLNYQIKSLGYSVIHKLDYQHFKQQIQKVRKDHEYYNYLKDKSKHIIDQYETVQCNICKSRHTKFNCPQYHYLPIRQQVISRYFKIQSMHKNSRQQNYKRSNFELNAFKCYINNQKNLKPFFIQINKKFTKRLTSQQEQMKRFIANFYNFNDINEDKSRNSMKNIIFDENNIQQGRVWNIQCDMIFDYDVYFPQDNAIKLQKKYNKHKNNLKISINNQQKY